MPRVPKPFLYRNWYCTKAGGERVRLCPEAAGLEAAERKLAEHLAGLIPPEPAPAADGRPTVGGFVERFMHHARVYYRLPDGSPSKEVVEYERSFREVLALFSHMPCEEFGKRHLKDAREAMIKAGLSRGVINQRIGRVVRAFRWGAEEEYVPDAVAAALMLVRPLQKGRSLAGDRPEVEPVPVEVVEATLPHLGVAVGLMVRLQLLTGMRPGEVVALCLSEVKRDAEPWVIDISHRHKMAYKGGKRVIVLGPRARALLAEQIEACVLPGDWYFFRPGEASKAICKHQFNMCYTVQSYGTAVERACKRAGVEVWTPNQLRHTFATMVRARYGLEAVAACLGHGKIETSQIYAERDSMLSVTVANDMG